MKSVLFQFAVIMCLLTMCRPMPSIDASINEVTILLEQDGKLISPVNGVATLEKKAFNFIMDFPRPMAVVVNASFDNEVFDLASKEKQLAALDAFQQNNMMAVSLFNEEQTIYLAREASSPYFYESENAHNFNKIELSNNRFRCTRTVNYFQVEESGKSQLELIDKPLFLVFVPESILETDSEKVRHQRNYLKIEWIESQDAEFADKNDSATDLSESTLGDLVSTDTFLSEEALFINAMAYLDLDSADIAFDLVTIQKMPDRPDETIIVIPEISYEVEYDFTFNSYILVANSKTGAITHAFAETDAWTSDAIILSGISIDSTVYNVSENDQAFGIRVHYHNSSQPNPYSNSTISLFTKAENTLKEILNSFDVKEYSAEWDTQCAGASVGHEKLLIVTKDKTNVFYDILVKNKIKETTSHEDENGDCQSKEKITYEEVFLRYDGEEYIE